MKSIKITFLSLFVVALSAGLVTSCSKDGNNLNENAKVMTFLKSFYN
jgi:hypothetical protein